MRKIKCTERPASVPKSSRRKERWTGELEAGHDGSRVAIAFTRLPERQPAEPRVSIFCDPDAPSFLSSIKFRVFLKWHRISFFGLHLCKAAIRQSETRGENTISSMLLFV